MSLQTTSVARRRSGPRHPLGVGFALLVLAGLGGTAAPALAEVRPYVGFRLGAQGFVDADITPELHVSRPLDAFGLSIGADIGRHLGVDLAGDHFEAVIRRRNGASIGELGAFTAIPQLRLRYPVLGNRLVPYALAGVGLATTEFNDRKRRGIGRDIDADDIGLAWSIGGGVEYFLNEDVTLGVETRFVGVPAQDIRFEGERRTASLDSFVVGAVMRAYLGDGAPGRPAAAPRPWPLYLGFHFGGATLVRDEIASGVEARGEHASIAPDVSQLYGAVLGHDLTPRVAVELAADGTEFNVRVPGVGLVGEFAFYVLTPRVRLTWPLLDGRLRPFVLGGVGVTYVEFNDRKPHGFDVPIKGIRGRDFGVAGAVGGGLEYRIVQHVGLAVDVRYVLARGHELMIGGERHDANLDSVLTTLGVHVSFW